MNLAAGQLWSTSPQSRYQHAWGRQNLASDVDAGRPSSSPRRTCPLGWAALPTCANQTARVAPFSAFPVYYSVLELFSSLGLEACGRLLCTPTKILPIA